ncbi:MAG: hypothetical protein IMW86_04585 [Hydrogenibacillus sp.]|nr:hypothetical protein [Hydrogenibacillus sp.]
MATLSFLLTVLISIYTLHAARLEWREAHRLSAAVLFGIALALPVAAWMMMGL